MKEKINKLKITNLINAQFRLKNVNWKVAKVIMVAKPGKSQNKGSPYRPISLLAILSPLFEKLIKKIKTNNRRNVIPSYQFGFRENHSTLDQILIIVDG